MQFRYWLSRMDLTVCFLTTTPTRIPENIDVGSPKSQSAILFVVAFGFGCIVHRPSFIRNCRRNSMGQITIESSSKPNRLRKNSCNSGTSYTVKRFVLITIRKNSQTLNCRCTMHHLVCLFFNCQSGYQILNSGIEG
jgi:hypothetical protein